MPESILPCVEELFQALDVDSSGLLLLHHRHRKVSPRVRAE